MKKGYVLLLLIIILTLSSCSLGRWHTLYDDSTAAANVTFLRIVNAVKEQDIPAIVELFSLNTRMQLSNINAQAEDLFEFIEGDIIKYGDAADHGVGADIQNDNGKKLKVIQSSFLLETDHGTYYIAIKECVQDTENSNNVGVMSVYIINAKDWTESYVFRGDGNWAPGINIMTNNHILD